MADNLEQLVIKRKDGSKDIYVKVTDLIKQKGKQKDAVNPTHYKSHPSGIECIEIIGSMNCAFGNAIKYLWRYNQKNFGEDLKKSIWYLRYVIKCEIDPVNAGIIPNTQRLLIAAQYPEFINEAFKLLLINGPDEVDILKAIDFIKEEIYRITGEKYDG